MTPDQLLRSALESLNSVEHFAGKAARMNAPWQGEAAHARHQCQQIREAIQRAMRDLDSGEEYQ
jgi:hypothetical protein